MSTLIIVNYLNEASILYSKKQISLPSSNNLFVSGKSSLNKVHKSKCKLADNSMLFLTLFMIPAYNISPSCSAY